MYKVEVPVISQNFMRNGREETLAHIRRFGAQRIFLALECYETDPQSRAKAMELLADNCRFLKEKGYEVGAWIRSSCFSLWLPAHWLIIPFLRCMRAAVNYAGIMCV